jgi:hypothetical protein
MANRFIDRKNHRIVKTHLIGLERAVFFSAPVVAASPAATPAASVAIAGSLHRDVAATSSVASSASEAIVTVDMGVIPLDPSCSTFGPVHTGYGRC